MHTFLHKYGFSVTKTIHRVAKWKKKGVSKHLAASGKNGDSVIKGLHEKYNHTVVCGPLKFTD